MCLSPNLHFVVASSCPTINACVNPSFTCRLGRTSKGFCGPPPPELISRARSSTCSHMEIRPNSIPGTTAVFKPPQLIGFPPHPGEQPVPAPSYGGEFGSRFSLSPSRVTSTQGGPLLSPLPLAHSCCFFELSCHVKPLNTFSAPPRAPPDQVYQQSLPSISDVPLRFSRPFFVFWVPQ